MKIALEGTYYRVYKRFTDLINEYLVGAEITHAVALTTNDLPGSMIGNLYRVVGKVISLAFVRLARQERWLLYLNK